MNVLACRYEPGYSQSLASRKSLDLEKIQTQIRTRVTAKRQAAQINVLAHRLPWTLHTATVEQ